MTPEQIQRLRELEAKATKGQRSFTLKDGWVVCSECDSNQD